MKITVDIPDDTHAVICTVLYGNWGNFTMSAQGFSSADLQDGAVLTIRRGGRDGQ